jgi:hypothetical protein
VSGTASRVAEQYRDRALGYSDHALREALHQVGIKYYAAFSMFFDPAYLRDHPELTPVNVFGDRMQQAGWYVGLCPSSEDYLQHKIRASTARSSHDRDTSTGSTGWTGDVLEEVAAVLQAVADSEANGVVLRWQDYLEDLREDDDRKLRVLHASLSRLLAARG